MASSERKKREYAQRETLIIDTARTLLLEVGYIDLNMDRIAEITEYSKGTIYQHFSCKEEILVQMLIQSAQQCGTFLGRGSQFQGTPRERVAAMALGYDLFIRLHPDHFKSKLLLQNESIRGKASSVFQKIWNKPSRIISGLSQRCYGTPLIKATFSFGRGSPLKRFPLVCGQEPLGPMCSCIRKSTCMPWEFPTRGRRYGKTYMRCWMGSGGIHFFTN